MSLLLSESRLYCHTIVTSRYSIDSRVRSKVEIGFRAFLSKPFTRRKKKTILRKQYFINSELMIINCCIIIIINLYRVLWLTITMWNKGDGTWCTGYIHAWRPRAGTPGSSSRYFRRPSKKSSSRGIARRISADLSRFGPPPFPIFRPTDI